MITINLCTIDWAAVGAISTSVMVMTTAITLFITIRQNNNNRNLQLNVLRHHIQLARFEAEKGKLLLLDNEIRTSSLKYIFRAIYRADYNAESIYELRRYHIDFDRADKEYYAYCPKKIEYTNEEELTDLINDIRSDYISLLEDMIFFIELMIYMPKEITKIPEYINNELDTLCEYNKLKHYIEKMGDYQNFHLHVRKIVDDLYSRIPMIEKHQEHLMHIMDDLLNTKQNDLDKII